jgi:hypothetical protein
MQRPAPFATVLAASIPLMLVLAGCDPRTSGDAGQAATPEAPITANDRQAGAAAAPPSPAAAPPGDDDVLSGVPQSIPLPPRNAPTPALPDATEVVYLCADGSDLRVRYAAGVANVILGGDTVALALSREASAEHGGEVYTGHAQGLRRIGGVVEFDTGQGEDRILRCREASSSA